MKILTLLFTVLLISFLGASGLADEKWLAPNDCIKRLIPAVRVESGKIFFQTPITGAKLLYSVDGAEKKLANYGEEIVLMKGQRLQINERHIFMEVLPVVVEGKIRFTIVVSEDYRSFGKDLTVSVSSFDLGASEVLAVTEAEGRAALQSAREKQTSQK